MSLSLTGNALAGRVLDRKCSTLLLPTRKRKQWPLTVLLCCCFSTPHGFPKWYVFVPAHDILSHWHFFFVSPNLIWIRFFAFLLWIYDLLVISQVTKVPFKFQEKFPWSTRRLTEQKWYRINEKSVIPSFSKILLHKLNCHTLLVGSKREMFLHE